MPDLYELNYTNSQNFDNQSIIPLLPVMQDFYPHRVDLSCSKSHAYLELVHIILGMQNSASQPVVHIQTRPNFPL